MENVRNLTIEDLEKRISTLGIEKYRSKQIFEWLHKKMVDNIDDIKNVGENNKIIIKQNFNTSYPTIYKEYISKIDETKKYLILLNDGNIIETVLMRYKFGFTICVSSEVGCNMGCKFCASTIGGFKRNLEVNELLAQVYLVSKRNNVKISNIVIMGSGEPLLNFDNIISFLKIINDKYGQNISLRNVTISTCGIVENIYKLAELDMPLTLALSLHAPNDSIRNKIMPISKKYKLRDVMDSMKYYYKKTKRRITFEYSLIKDVNDGEINAYKLIDLFDKCLFFGQVNFNINLIPVNVIRERDYERPSTDKVKLFKKILEDSKLSVTIRRELGNDISGSCGQLRSSVK